MVKLLVSLLGLVALCLLDGCTTLFETRSHSAPEPQGRAIDTGVKWVTNVDNLESHHRFQLTRYIVEIDGATRFHGGSVADIEEGARLRVVGTYHDDLVVANAIYIERPAEPPTMSATQPSAMQSATADELTPTPTPAGEQAPPPQLADGSPDAEPSQTEALETVTRPAAVPATQPPATQSESAAAAATTVPAQTSPQQAKQAGAGSKRSPRGAEMRDSNVVKVETRSAVTASREFSQLDFDRRSLPMLLASGWTLDRYPDPLDGVSRCVLQSPAFTIFDGYYPANAWFRVSLVRAWVETDSNIDTSYPEQGLRVDEGGLVPFAATLVDKQTAYTDAPVLDAMAKGQTLTVALGFWPTWPKTKTQTANIDLSGFANAYAALRACSQQQQAALEGSHDP